MQVLFDHNKGVVSLSNFEWHRNDFCRHFKATKNASEFIGKWQELTTFDRVLQVVLTKVIAQDESQDTPSSVEPAYEEQEHASVANDGAEERGKDACAQPPPAKKPKKSDTVQMVNVVESK